MEANFEKTMDILFRHEGGYSNHPNDKGGPTNWGITHIDLAKWKGKKSVTPAEVKALTKAEAKLIYKAFYWDKLRCDELPSGVDYLIYDMGINAGLSRGIKIAQKVVGVPEDGKLGPVTMAAIKKMNPVEFIDKYSEERRKHYRSLSTFDVFGRGWLRRVDESQQFAKNMVDG